MRANLCPALLILASLSLCAAQSRGALPRESAVWQQFFPANDGLAEGTQAVRPGGAPHPAVVRIVVPEGEATSFGSGTLVDVRDQFGLVVSNWHVVRDARGPVEVVFPDGFRSKARPVKVDHDWDLAALVTWRPNVRPVPISSRTPQPGDTLTICGYGPGNYRAQTGRCTQYYSPRIDLPQQMVELDVQARQGDSGGPIFNDRGELAGVLFGAGQGTTLGSFGGRVESFLASIAPDIGRAADEALLAGSERPIKNRQASTREAALSGVGEAPERRQSTAAARESSADYSDGDYSDEEELGPDSTRIAQLWEERAGPSEHPAARAAATPGSPQQATMFAQVKTALAAVGLFSIAAQLLKAAR